jgi:uncharacterized membrane protein YeiB
MEESGRVMAGPTDPHRRIEAIDMIRGFALFGVLLVNMYNFGATSAIWNGEIDRIAFSVTRFFFEIAKVGAALLLVVIDFIGQKLIGAALLTMFGSQA